MTAPSGVRPARVTVKPPAVNTSWLFARSVVAFSVLPPMVAAPAADSVFVKEGGTGVAFGNVVVVVVVDDLLAVVVVVEETPRVTA